MTEKKLFQVACSAANVLTDIGAEAEQDREGTEGLWWGLWSDFCFQSGVVPLPASAALLVEWVDRVAPSRLSDDTVRRVVDVVVERHRSAGVVFDFEVYA